MAKKDLTVEPGTETVTETTTETTDPVDGTTKVVETTPKIPRKKTASEKLALLGIGEPAKPDREQLAGEKFPQCGQLVHFVMNVGASRGKHRPLMITSVNSPTLTTVNGQVHIEPGDARLAYGTNVLFEYGVPYDPNGRPGSWHYPEDAAQERLAQNRIEDEDAKPDPNKPEIESAYENDDE